MIDSKIPYNGVSYTALRYAAMRKDRPFSIDNLMQTLGNKFKKRYDVNRSLKRLTGYGFIDNTGDTWVITELGLDYLRKTAKPYYGDTREW